MEKSLSEAGFHIETTAGHRIFEIVKKVSKAMMTTRWICIFFHHKSFSDEYRFDIPSQSGIKCLSVKRAGNKNKSLYRIRQLTFNIKKNDAEDLN